MNQVSTITGPTAAPERRRLAAVAARFAPRAAIVLGVPTVVLVWVGALYVVYGAAPVLGQGRALLLTATLLTVALVALCALIVRHEHSLALACEAAEAGTRARAEFLAVMSHELRTPMNAVLGFANTLLESKLDPEQRLAAMALHDAGDNLLRTLNDILDFAHLDAGRIAFEATAFSPAALTQTAVGIVEQNARQKRLKLRIETAPGLPPALEGDAGRIRQVLVSLLSNAVKFTERGEITVVARCLDRSETSATMQWSVTDTGVGIAPDRIDGLFFGFVQADSSVNRRFGGAGLGLAICKRIVDQMGGRIGASSAIGRGSSFSFSITLPLSAAVFETEKEAGSAARDFKTRIAEFGRPLRILLAEDNPTNQLVGKQILREFDAIIDVAANGTEAVQFAGEFAYDVILMDMQMPVMNGIEATRAIRAGAGGHAQVPVLALTANAYPEDVSACLGAGMNGFVAKPVRKFVLVEAILRVLPRVPGGDVPAAFSLAFSKSGADDLVVEQAPIIDHSAVDEFIEEIGGDAAENIFTTFLDEAERRLGVLRDLNCDDRAAIQFEAHTLIGSAGTFGMMRLSQLSRQLERGAATIAPEDYRSAVERLMEAYQISRRELLDYLRRVAEMRAMMEN
jgi:signal transduction histidine kinase/HPt (histidine-containing phosphotransfer) domain-containing protein